MQTLNLNYIMQRKHIFKNRNLLPKNRAYRLRLGTVGLFSGKIQRFELVYLRGFKKLVRRAYIKRRMRFRRKKVWFFLRPNCVLSSKSVNARMGAGTGVLTRLSITLQSHKSFIEFKNYSPFHLRKLPKYTRYRYPLKYVVVGKQTLFLLQTFKDTTQVTIQLSVYNRSSKSFVQKKKKILKGNNQPIMFVRAPKHFKSGKQHAFIYKSYKYKHLLLRSNSLLLLQMKPYTLFSIIREVNEPFLRKDLLLSRVSIRGNLRVAYF